MKIFLCGNERVLYRVANWMIMVYIVLAVLKADFIGKNIHYNV